MIHFNKAKHLLLLSAFLVMAAVSAIAQPLSGTYTVGGATPNYNTLPDAVNDLQAKGVSGPVIFNLRTGTYSGAQYTINAITGASATNRITFQSETGLASNVTISYTATGSADNFVFKLNSASYLTFKNLTVTNIATATYARAFHFESAPSYDSIANCVFSSTLTSSTSSSAALIYANSINGTNNVIVGNTFTDAAYGVYWLGNSTTSYANNTVIRSNTFTNQNYRAVYNYNSFNATIAGNTISSTRNGFIAGVYCYYSDVANISNNTITVNNANSGSVYGIDMQVCNGNSTNYNKITSNNITLINTDYAYTYGLNANSSPYDSILNNVINTSTQWGYYNYPYYNSSSNNSYASGNSITGLANNYYLYFYPLNNCSNSYFNNNAVNITGGTSGGMYVYGLTSGSSSTMYGNTMNFTGRYTYGSTYAYMVQYSSTPTFKKNSVTITSPGSIYSYFGYSNSSPVIDSNTINMTSTYTNYWYNYMGYSCSNGSISYNNVTTTNNYYVFGIYADNASNINFIGNNVKATALSSTGYGVYGFYSYYTSNCKFINNKVAALATAYSSSSAMAMYVPYSTNAQVYNNTVVARGTYQGDALYMYGSSNFSIKNNTLYKEGTGYGSGLTTTNYSPVGTSTVMNNVINSMGYRGWSSNFALATSRPAADYNLVYSPANVFFDDYNYTGYSLISIRTNTNTNLNSLSYNAATAFPNRTAGDLTPDPTAPAVWALNGRGVHDVANVPKDITGANRPANKPAGVPDLGAYEVLPTSIPPDAVANPAAPSPGLQYFTFGQDTVAVIDWGTTTPLPATATVKQYSGEAPASFAFPFYMYFHTDIDVPAGSYNHTAHIYYKDPQTGTTAAESGLRLVKKLGAGTWTPYTAPASSTNSIRNIISTTGLTDFGSHTGSDVANNASVSRLVSPTPTFCAPNTQTIKVTVKNTGNNTLNNVKVDWYMDGLLMGTVNYNNAINTFLVQPDSVQLTLGTYNFTTAKPVRFMAYSYLPNGVPDAATVDDTLRAVITPGLNGEYTVGGTPTPDFVDVKEAVDILNQWGVCGPTVFKIRDSVGAYQGAGIINAPIIGGSTINRVTFRSESGNAANVKIVGTNSNPVFGLDNVTDVTIKNVTINGLGTTAISVAGSPKRDTVMGCFLNTPTSSSTNNYQAVISSMSSNFSGRDNAFIKNTLTGSAVGICLYSNSSSSIKNVVDSNTFSSHYYCDLYTYSLYSPKIRGNNFGAIGYAYGNVVYNYSNYTSGTEPIEIIGNTCDITGTGTGSTYLYLVYNINGSSTTRAKVAYNKIKISNPTGYVYNYLGYSGANYADIYNNDISITANGGYGFGAMYGNYTETKIYNNIVNATFGSNGGSAFYLYSYGGSNLQIYNNTFVNNSAGTGYAGYLYASSSNTINNYNNVFANLGTGGNALWMNNSNYSDYNNLFSANGNHFNYNGTADTSLNNWRSTRSMEKNSICYNPGLMGLGDLHPDAANPASWSLNGRGKHIAGNVVDRDGNARETDITLGVPDIGAYEFEPTVEPPLARAVPAALPAAGTTQVFTFGQDTVVTLTWNPMTIVSNTIEVRQYSGRKGPSYPSGLNNMYFYTNVLTQNVSADYTANVYYKDIWMGTIASEPDLRMLKKVNPNPWVAYNDVLSSSDNGRNIITANDLTSTGMFTGVENGGLFSAVITPNGSSTFCSGGNVQLDANVGIGYTYKWYKNGIEIPGATAASYIATAPGDYTVQVTDPNATPSAVTATSVAVGVAVIAPPSAIISASGPLTYCTGGSLTLMANTGLNLWYQWQFNGNNIPGANQPNLDVNSAGNYSVTVNNIGCATTSPITTINAGPLHVALGDDTSFCESKVLVLDAGYPGAHYLWSTGDTTQTISITTVSGDYSVFVDAGPNCQARDTIAVHVDPLPSLIGISYISMGGSTFQFSPSGAVNASSYMWMYNDGTVDFNATTTHTFPATGDWMVTLIAFNDCGTDTSILDLRALNVANVEQSNFNLYPNPATEQVTLSADKVKLSEVLIINNLGQVVYRGTEDKVKSTTIDVKGLVDGHYIIRANTSDGKIISKPFDVLK